MSKYDCVLLAFAAFVLAIAFAIAPEGSASSHRQWASTASIHLSGISRNSALLPDEDFPPH